MDPNVRQEIEDLSQLIQALQRGIAAQAAEIEQLQHRLDGERSNRTLVMPMAALLGKPSGYSAA